MLRIAFPPALSERSPIFLSAFLATVRAIGCFLRWVGLNNAAAACLPVSATEWPFPFSDPRLRRLSVPPCVLLLLRDDALLLAREGEPLLLEAELPLLARPLPAGGEDERLWRAGAADPERPELDPFPRALLLEDDEPPLPLAAAPRFWLPAAAALPRLEPLFPLVLFPLAPFPPAPLPDADLLAVPRLEEALLDFVLVEAFPLPELDLPVAEAERPLLDAERLPPDAERPPLDVERPLPDVERPLPDLERPLLDADRPLLDPDRGSDDSASLASARRRAWASFAIRSPDAFPLFNFRAAVARLTEAASLAAARALRGLLAVVAMG